MQTLKRISNTRPVTDPRIISLCTEGKSIVSPVMANVPSSSYQLPTFETTERDECNMQEIDAAVTMSISPRAITTPPPGHTGVWLGSDMRQGGRNLYMMISRNGTRITNSFDLGTKFKLYTRNGTFVQSGAWDGSLTPYGMGIVFVGINSSETIGKFAAVHFGGIG